MSLGNNAQCVLLHTKWKQEINHLSKCTCCSSKSARSGAHPSTPPSACNASRRATNELAKDRATETAIMRDHRRLHARAAEWNRAGGASRALAAAKLSTNYRASSLHYLLFRERHRLSDTCRHGRVPNTSIPCPPELWCTRLRQPWPPQCCAVPSAARALRTVMSTTN